MGDTLHGLADGLHSRSCTLSSRRHRRTARFSAKDRRNHNWQIFSCPSALSLSPAIRCAAGEKRQYDSYCFVDPNRRR